MPAGLIELGLSMLPLVTIPELLNMLTLTAALRTTLENSHRSSDLMVTRPGWTMMLPHRLALIESLMTLNNMMTGRRCTTVPSGSTPLPALLVHTLAKLTEYLLIAKIKIVRVMLEVGGLILSMHPQHQLMMPRLSPLAQETMLGTLILQSLAMSESAIKTFTRTSSRIKLK